MADTWNLTPNFSGFDKNNGQERTQGMDTGDEGKLRAVVPWLEWGGALTATYADYVTQGANIGISKAQDKIRDAQLQSALTSEMSAGRDASKMSVGAYSSYKRKHSLLRPDEVRTMTSFFI